MSHWAELDNDNFVIRVVVGNNSHQDEGYLWLVENLGGRWMQTSYNATIRKHFAGPGYYYDESLDAFIPPKPFDSWILNSKTCLWEPPAEMPNDGKNYEWDEQTRTWIEETE